MKWFLVGLLFFFTTPRWAMAALGSNLEPAPKLGRFVIRESHTARRKLCEYASPNGKVFAVTWSGAQNPDLRPLLGKYFDDFANAQRLAALQPRKFRGPFQIVKGDKVTVERWGHGRDLHGRGYVPELFPAGVSLSDIR